MKRLEREYAVFFALGGDVVYSVEDESAVRGRFEDIPDSNYDKDLLEEILDELEAGDWASIGPYIILKGPYQREHTDGK